MSKAMECPSCEQGTLAPANDIVSEIDGHFFVESGSRCTHCREEFVPEKEGQKMIEAARKLGLWGEPVKLGRKLSKTSRGIIFRLPKDLEKSMHIKGNEQVAFSRAGRRIYVDILPS